MLLALVPPLAASPAAGAPAVACRGPAVATAAGRTAALVVQMPDGEIQSRCVAFSEPRITGLDLLRRSGLSIAYEDHGAGQVTICSIEGRGCAFPERPCFCQCRDPSKDCRFWALYRADAGKWVFSELGAAAAVVRPGDVHGWRWGEHAGRGNPPDRAASPACDRTVASPVATRPARPAPGALAAAGLAFALVGLSTWAVALRRRRREET